MKTDRKVKKIEKEILEMIENYDARKINLAKATTLIHQISWLVIKISDLEKIIDEEGVVEIYSNGAAQEGRKVSSNVQVLGGFQKTYSTLVAKLFDLIKSADEKKKDNPLADFQKAYRHDETKMRGRRLP